MVSFEPGWDGRLGAMMRYASSASTCRRSIIARRALLSLEAASTCCNDFHEGHQHDIARRPL